VIDVAVCHFYFMSNTVIDVAVCNVVIDVAVCNVVIDVAVCHLYLCVVQIFNEALYMMLRKALKEIAAPDVALAWRAFTMHTITPNILGLAFGSRPGTHSLYPHP
jgi:hypothetical protein